MKKCIFAFIFVVIFLVGAMTCLADGIPSPDAKKLLDYMVLVNKENRLPEGWEDILVLETVPDFEGGHSHQVEREALSMFWLLRDDLLQNYGIQIELDSCYRSVEAQQDIWDRFTDEYGIDYVKKYVAVPGYSEHHTGLAIDICLVKDGVTIDENDDMIAEREIFAIIHSRLADYGFILRYPEGKEEVTGYGYEPWHFRYVGDVQTAHEIMDGGYTLEEYLDMLNP